MKDFAIYNKITGEKYNFEITDDILKILSFFLYLPDNKHLFLEFPVSSGNFYLLKDAANYAEDLWIIESVLEKKNIENSKVNKK